MEGEQSQSERRINPSTTTTDDDPGPSTSSTWHNTQDREEVESEARPSAEVRVAEGDEPPPAEGASTDRHHHFNRRRQHRRQSGSIRYNFDVTNRGSNTMTDDFWSCLVVLATFWFFASMTLILGFYGTVDLQLGPNYSRLLTSNELFVQSIKAQQLDEQINGTMLYGFHKKPSLDVETSWSESHNASVEPSFHKEWVYFLNKGSKVNISYEVMYPGSVPLSLVIAEGRENLLEWIDDPSYPNTTLSWNTIYGSGTINQDIPDSATYFIAVGNLNSETVEVQLNFTLKALVYNTSQPYSKCSLYSRACSFELFWFKPNYAIVTSPGEVNADDDWCLRLSYGPRWLTYILGSAAMTILVLLLFKFCNMFQPSQGALSSGSQPWGNAADQEPLLSPKDDDSSSYGSSYDSLSNSEDDLEDWTPQQDGKAPVAGENSSSSVNPKRMCVICFTSPRDCFFLPCGHCAACFTCGSRIAEENGTCPVCRRKMKKVRKIFSV